MVSKEEAKNAWQVVISFSIARQNQQSFSKDDITISLQNAILTLNKYFMETSNED